MENFTTVFSEDFNAEKHLNWDVINDGVMGGISQSNFRIQSDQTALFSGIVSRENNGGFASVRAMLLQPVPGDFKKLVIRIKGDGKTYSFRIRSDRNFDGVVYAVSFPTKKDEWEEHEFSPADFIPTFRGITLTDVPALADLQISQIGLLIAGRQWGDFRLIIDWIKVVGKSC